MINFNKKEKSFFESQAHSDANNKQQQFPDKIIPKRPQVNEIQGKKGTNSKKPTLDDVSAARKAITNSCSIY